jgi:hypothetical protein
VTSGKRRHLPLQRLEPAGLCFCVDLAAGVTPWPAAPGVRHPQISQEALVVCLSLNTWSLTPDPGSDCSSPLVLLSDRRFQNFRKKVKREVAGKFDAVRGFESHWDISAFRGHFLSPETRMSIRSRTVVTPTYM